MRINLHAEDLLMGNPQRKTVVYDRVLAFSPALFVFAAMLSVVAVIYFLGKPTSKTSSREQSVATGQLVNERLELEVLKLEHEADRIGRMDRVLGASDALDKEMVNRELSLLINARRHMFGAVFDFEGELLGAYGIDPELLARRESSGVPTDAVAAGLQGHTAGGFVKLGERMAIVALSPAGVTGVTSRGRLDTAGVVVVGQILTPGFLDRVLTGINADLQFVEGNRVIETTLEASMPSQAIAIPVMVSRMFGQKFLAVQAIVTPEFGWRIHGGWRIWVGVFLVLNTMLGVLVGFWLQRRQSVQLQGTVQVALSDQAKLHDEKLKKSEQVQRDLESRAKKTIDLLAIDDLEFALFVERVRSAETEAAQSLERLRGQFASAEAVPAVADIVASLLRAVYQIRNEAQLFKLQYVVHAAKSFEGFLTRVRNGEVRAEASLVEDLVAKMHELSAQVGSYCELREELLGKQSLHEADLQKSRVQVQWLKSMTARALALLKNPSREGIEAERLAAEFEKAVAMLNRHDLRQLIDRYQPIAQELAGRVGKVIGPLAFDGTTAFFKPETMSKLSDLLSNALRNAIHHGIETPEQRRQSGKPEAGRIVIASRTWADTVEIQIADDGKGADAERLAQRAIQRGLLTKAEVDTMTQDEKLALMFEPGLTTSAVVSEVSGRGVGMDVVRQAAVDLGGGVEVASQPGEGLTVRAWFPDDVSRFKTRSTVFSVRSEVSSLLKARQYLFDRAGIKVEFEAPVASRGMVFADRLFIVEGWRQLILAMIDSLPRGTICRIRQEEISPANRAGCPVVRYQVHFDGGQFDGADFSSEAVLEKLTESHFFDSAQNVFLEACVDCATQVLNHKKLIELSISSNLPVHMCEYPLLILLPENSDALREKVEERLALMTGGWICQYYDYRDLSSFVAAAAQGVPLAFVDDSGVKRAELRDGLSGLADLNVIVCVEDIAALSPELVFTMGRDPLLVSGEIDAAAIDQALEMSLLKMFRGKAQAAASAAKSATLALIDSDDNAGPVAA